MVAAASVYKSVVLVAHVIAGKVYVIITDQLVMVPTSEFALSLALSIQFPLGVPYKEEKAVTFETFDVGPTPLAASAAYVLLNGAEPLLTAVAEELLILVFVKLSPDPPLRLTRFKIFPLGAFIFNIRSPS